MHSRNRSTSGSVDDSFTPSTHREPRGTAPGSINVVLHNVPSGVTLLNQTSAGPAVLVTSGNMAAGQPLPATLLFRAPSMASIQGITFTASS
jgi:hypothetical protein